MISAIRFESYKIDRITFEMQHSINLLAANVISDTWDLSFAIGKPLFSKSHKKYISTLQAKLQLMPEKKKDSPTTTDEKPLVKCEVSIAGLFSVEEGKLEKEVESNLLKLQLPAILTPYLRGTITAIMSHAGFGSIILPLINMQEVARSIEKDLEVQEIA